MPSQTQHDAEPEQAAGFAGKFPPRLTHLRLVQRHAMEEHEFTAAAQPQDQQPQRQQENHQPDHRRHDPIKIVQCEISGLLESMHETFPHIAGIRIGMVAAAIISAESAAAFTEHGQPCAKADGEPFHEVKRFEEHLLDPFERGADRLGHADLIARSWQRLDWHKPASHCYKIATRIARIKSAS